MQEARIDRSMTVSETALPLSSEPAPAATSETSSDLALKDALKTAEEREQKQSVEVENKTDGEAIEANKDDEPKSPKSPEQREIDRLRKSVSRTVRQREEARARLALIESNQSKSTPSDNETLSFTQAQLQEFVTSEAKKIAPTIQAMNAEIEHINSVADKLEKSWGKEKFDELASDLNEVFGGLVDSQGMRKAATDAIFQSDNPKAIIEYLTDPDNEEEAESVSRMSPLQAGRAMARQRRSRCPRDGRA